VDVESFAVVETTALAMAMMQYVQEERDAIGDADPPLTVSDVKFDESTLESRRVLLPVHILEYKYDGKVRVARVFWCGLRAKQS
jgi:hypothetical protein